MKKIIVTIVLTGFLFGCESDKEDDISGTAVVFKFIHHWDNTPVTFADFNAIKFTNAIGNELSIERLRYLISAITFTRSSGETITLDSYNLLDLSDEESLQFLTNTSISSNTYSNVSFTFGFSNQDNIDGAYTDLNSASWNVPMMLGGGYHYMQLDGKYLNAANSESGYNYHAIRAADNPGQNPSFPQDTFFRVDLGEITITENTQITISMNIAQWFKNPYNWDLNVYDQMLMPNSAAQILMYQNGQNVFNLESIE